MHCDDYMEQMSAALDDMLTEEEWQALKAHLASCPSCDALWRQLKENKALLQETPLLELPAGYHAEWKAKWQQLLQEEAKEEPKAEEATKEETKTKEETGTLVSFPTKKTKQPWKKMGVAAAAVFLMAVVGMGGRSLVEYQKHQEEVTGSALLETEGATEAAEDTQEAGSMPSVASAGVEAGESAKEAAPKEATTQAPTEGTEESAVPSDQQESAVPFSQAVAEETDALPPSPPPKGRAMESEVVEESAAVAEEEAPVEASLEPMTTAQQPQTIAAEEPETSAEGAAGAADQANLSAATNDLTNQPPLRSSATMAESAESVAVEAAEKKVLSRTKVTLQVDAIEETMASLSQLGEETTVLQEAKKVVVKDEASKEESLLVQVRALGTVVEETSADEDITFWYTKTQETLAAKQEEVAALQAKAAEAAMTEEETASFEAAQAEIASCKTSLSQWDEALGQTEVEVQLVEVQTP